MDYSTNNEAPRDSSESQMDGHNVSYPFNSGASMTPDDGLTAESRGDLAEQQGTDTPQVAAGSPASSTWLTVSPTYFEDRYAEDTANARLEVMAQIMTDTIEEATEKRLERYARNLGVDLDELIKKVGTEEIIGRAVAIECAEDIGKSAAHERYSYEHIQALAAYDGSPVRQTDRLPVNGNNAMHLTNHGLLFGDELTKKDKDLCKTMDIATLIDNPVSGTYLAIQYHKYTNGKGGSQDYAANDMDSFAKAVKKMKLTHARASRALDPTGTMYPVVFVAVVDGSYWSKDAKKTLSRAGKAAKAIVPGGFYVCTTAELQGFYDSVSRA